MKIHPFRALRPADSARACSVSSLPYDVMSTEEARAIAEGNADSFLHVIRPEIDLPAGASFSSADAYARAAAALDGLAARGAFIRESEPSVYLYRQIMGAHVQTAVVACVETADYESGSIVRHEKTRQDKEDDRAAHILATRAHTGQVFLCHRDEPAVDAAVAAETAREPLYDFTPADGIRHVVWRAADPAALAAAFGAVGKFYIADGHHRSAAAARAARKLAQSEPDNAEASRFMACVFPASQLALMPYNRCVKDLNGLTPERFLDAARARGFTVEEAASPEGLSRCSCAARIGARWHRLSWKLPPAAAADPVAGLDVSHLQNELLAPVLGVTDPRTDPRIFFVGGIRGAGELDKLVASGEAAVAFAMHPTSVEDMTAIADAGETMPPKSTWFEPKLRSGLLVHTF